MRELTLYRGKRVFITGHTGFKGAWLSQMLLLLGAEVTGYALAPEPNAPLFDALGGARDMRSIVGDVRDFDALLAAFTEAKPEIVIHLAAQPIVRTSYLAPRETYETNVMGTVNMLECLRRTDTARSFVNVTTDKVYRNMERAAGYREDEALDGFDPYSNSKSCSELVTHSYQRSFFADRGVRISTARAGNVIGGGDTAKDRIVPDCIRAVTAGKPIVVRNPHSTRPYQHVLDPLYAYLLLAQSQYDDARIAGSYNVGPDDCDCVTTGTLATLFCDAWGEDARWENHAEPNAPHEASFLKLDNRLLKRTIRWRPRLHIREAVRLTVDWTKAAMGGEDARALTRAQIEAFLQK